MVLITNFLKSTFYNISKGMHLVLFYMKFFTEEGNLFESGLLSILI